MILFVCYDCGMEEEKTKDEKLKEDLLINLDLEDENFYSFKDDLLPETKEVFDKINFKDPNRYFPYLNSFTDESQMKLSGIYCLLNTSNNKYYFGSALNFIARFQSHLRQFRNNYHSNGYMQNAYNQDSVLSFRFIILEIYKDISKEDLWDREQWYIDKFHDDQKMCYNIEKKAGSPMAGRKSSEYTKSLLSKIFSGQGNPMYGLKGSDHPASYPCPEDRKQKISEALKNSETHKANCKRGEEHPGWGKPLSDEIKFKISETVTTHNITKEFLYEEYVVKQKSVSVIAEEFGCAFSTMLRHINEFDIPRHKKRKVRPFTWKKPKVPSRIKGTKKPFIITKEFLIEEYIVKEKSISAIRKEFNIWEERLKNKINEFGLMKIKPEKVSLTKEFLLKEYINKNKTSVELSKETGYSLGHLFEKLKEFGIKKV